jgi:hypothetical protein
MAFDAPDGVFHRRIFQRCLVDFLDDALRVARFSAQ